MNFFLAFMFENRTFPLATGVFVSSKETSILVEKARPTTLHFYLYTDDLTCIHFFIPPFKQIYIKFMYSSLHLHLSRVH